MGGLFLAEAIEQPGHWVGWLRTKQMDCLLNASSLSWRGRTIKIGASLGLQAYGAMDNSQELLGRADAAMYQTKRLRADLTARQAIA